MTTFIVCVVLLLLLPYLLSLLLLIPVLIYLGWVELIEIIRYFLRS